MVLKIIQPVSVRMQALKIIQLVSVRMQVLKIVQSVSVKIQTEKLINVWVLQTPPLCTFLSCTPVHRCIYIHFLYSGNGPIVKLCA